MATTRCLRVALVATFLSVSAQPIVSQEPDGNKRSNVHPTAAREVRAGAIDGDAVRLDGRLDEAAWRRVEPATDFIQQRPDEGEPATQRTEVRFLIGPDALYVGARMYDDLGAEGVVSRLVRRDGFAESDLLTITFDTFHDHLGQTQFSINPAGVRGDAYGPGGAGVDGSWDPVWKAATSIDSLGWAAELRIPLSQLRFPTDSLQTWGLQVTRQVNRLNERSMWAFWGLNQSGGPAFYGHLGGLELRSSPAKAELLPYVVGVSTNVPDVDAGDPFADPHALDYRVGGDLRYFLTSNLTLSATVNPDFGQVEVDPAVVNLSAFETFFPEKRPFFIEGSGLFRFGNLWCFFCSNVSSLSLFFSRRIGRPPQAAGLAFDAGDYADIPDNTTILGAAKITGGTHSGWSVGLLDAATNREMATVDLGGTRFAREVEPFTNYFVGRVAKDLKEGQWQVAGFGTSVVRDLSDPDLAVRLNRHAESFGLAQELWWGQRTYFVLTQLAVTQISGEPEAILRAQHSSARYFQRPDRGHGSNRFLTDRYDSTLTSMRGFGAYARLAKQSGELLWEVSTNVRTPGFENNDIAFLTRADYWWMNANVFRQWTTPTSWYRQISFNIGGQQQYNFDGDLNDRQSNLAFGWTFPNYWGFVTFWIHRFPVLDERLTRGGPVVGVPHSDYFYWNVSTDSRKSVALDAYVDRGCDGDGKCSFNMSLGATFRPAPSVTLSVSPSYGYNESAQQYVTDVADPTASDFYGRRYVFADLTQRSIAMNTRVSVTFTPDLTLELFAQPFIASGQYTRFKEFAEPRSRDKLVYGGDVGTITETAPGYSVDPDGAGPAASFALDDPDFNFRSLRGNAVLRWEFIPGSTVFLVWTQSRSDAAAIGDLDFRRDTRALWRAPAENIFLVKFNYWLGI
jgi:hypothetical protein